MGSPHVAVALAAPEALPLRLHTENAIRAGLLGVIPGGAVDEGSGKVARTGSRGAKQGAEKGMIRV